MNEKNEMLGKLSKIANLSNSAFKDITAPTNSPGSVGQENEIKPTNEPNLLSDADLQRTGEHTVNNSLLGSTDNPTNPNTPTSNVIGMNAPKGTPLGSVVGGKMAVDLVDILLPSLTVWAIAAIGYNMQKKHLQLTAKEKEVLTPAVQNWLNSINVDFNNPFYNLLFVVAAIYGTKVIDALPEIKKVVKPSKNQTGSKETGQTANIISYEENISKMEKEAALKVIMKDKKKPRAWAENWYKNNIEPILKKQAS